MKKLIFLVLRVWLVAILMTGWTGCSGGGGSDSTPNNTDNEDISYAESQNINVKKYVDSAVTLAKAFEEGNNLIAVSLGEDWEYKEWTTDDLSLFLSNEEIESLLAELKVLIKNDIVPAAGSLKEAADEIINAEENLNLSSSLLDNNLIQPTSVVGGVLVVLTVFAFVAGAGKGAADAINETSDMPDSTIEEKKDKLIAILMKWPEASAEAIKGVISTGVEEFAAWATGTAGLKKINVLIQILSAGHSVGTVHDGMGIKRCDDPESQELHNNLNMQAIDTTNLSPDEIYIGRSDESGVFHNIPEGNWTFVTFQDGYIRGITECYELLESENINEITVEMEPDGTLQDDNIFERNLIRNPGAEDGPHLDNPYDPVCKHIEDWGANGDLDCIKTYDQYLEVVAEDSRHELGANFPPPQSGSWLFTCWGNGPSHYEQTIDISSAETEIDAGGVKCRFSVWMGGLSSLWTYEPPIVQVWFSEEPVGGNMTFQASTREELDYKGTMELFEGERILAPGTRSIYISITSNSALGFIDNLSLVLKQ